MSATNIRTIAEIQNTNWGRIEMYEERIRRKCAVSAINTQVYRPAKFAQFDSNVLRTKLQPTTVTMNHKTVEKCPLLKLSRRRINIHVNTAENYFSESI